MNWIKRVRTLIGRFWTRLFGDRDFILWVENLVGLLASRQQAAQDKWLAGRALSLSGKYQDRLPHAILLRRRTIHLDSGEIVNEVGRPAMPLHLVLNGDAAPDELDDVEGCYILRSMYQTPAPAMLTDHVLDSSRTLFAGLDFEVSGDGRFMLYVDPDDEKLGWPKVSITDGGGNIVECYKVFGWLRASSAVEDAVAAFESPELVDCAEAAWSVHQRGATVLSAKRLLAAASGSVICEEGGELSDVWDEADLHCAIVGERMYSSTSALAPWLSVGDVLRAGDTVFGELRWFPEVLEDGEKTYDGMSSLHVPGVHVMTDFGELYASNTDDTQADEFGGERMLPLRRGGESVQGYMRRCAELRAAGAPSMPVPASLNPCKFVLDVLRNGCGYVAVLSVSAVRKAAAALACIRNSAVAAGMLHVYLRASGESPVRVASSVSATAMAAAVTVSITARVKDMAASARVLL